MNSSPRVLAGFAAIFLLVVPLGAVEEGHGTGASATEIAAASDEGKNAIKTFKFDPGLKVDLWAAEPMLANPVAFTQDEKGRWYIAETFRQERGIEDDRAHPEWQDDDIASQSIADRLAMMHKFVPDPAKFAEKFAKYEDRIRRVEDTTGSGVANQSTVFADGFRDPLDGTGAGIIARGKEVWWTCIPTLWHFRDNKGDGVADVKEKLLTGFGIKFALRGHDMHGLRFGPDGKLYFSIGDRALHVQTKEGKDVAQTESGSIMRCNPDGTGFEIFCTGVRNPQELAFDEHGNLFTGDNNSDAGDKARFTYLVQGADCGWRMAFQYLGDRGPWMRERAWDEKIGRSVRYVVPCVANIGNGPSGLTYNPGTGLSAKYFGKFYLSDFRGGANASVVHEISVQPEGAFFTAKARDWVKGVLTTDVEFGNDGSLYVLDWVASWGGVGKGRIYKFSDPEADTALQKATEKLIADGMEGRPEPELVKLLGHQDQRVRQAAQFELAGRGEGSIKTFTQVSADPHAPSLARLHAIWGLGQLAGKMPSALAGLPALLGDRDAELRAQAAGALGTGRVARTAPALIGLLKDPANRVRFFAALALGKLGEKTAFEPLCTLLAENDDRDPIVRHGGVMGLLGCGSPEQVAAKAADASAAVRGAAVVVLRRFGSPLVARFLQDQDASVVLEAARAIYDVPIEAAMPALAKLTEREGVSDPHTLSRAIGAHYRLGQATDAQALAALAGRSSAPEGARKEALEVLALWANPNPKDRLLNQWRPLPPRGGGDAAAAAAGVAPALLATASGPLPEAAAKLASLYALPGVGESLLQLASSGRASINARVEAIHALAALKDPRLSEAVQTASQDSNAKVRSAALQALAGADPATAVKAAAEVLAHGSVGEKQGALHALGQVPSPAAEALLTAQLDQLAAGSLPAALQLDLLEAAQQHPSAALHTKAAQYLASLPAADELAKYRTALEGGDAERGRKIFREKAETQCLRCHKCEIGDSVVGPELTHIGAAKDRAYILESIVFPNKQIAAGFETVVLTLANGQIIAGRLAAQKSDALQVETFDAQNKPHLTVVPLAQIKQRDSAPSPMPPGMAEVLSRAELRDLVEYLATRK